MNISTNLVSRMNLWHNAATQAPKSSEGGARTVHQQTIDAFASQFEELSKLDQTCVDINTNPGEVKVQTPLGMKSLLKTADGFVMTLVNRDVPHPMNWYAETTTTYTVNEKNNTLSVRESETHGNAARSNYYEKPVVKENYVLDLNTQGLWIQGDDRMNGFLCGQPDLAAPARPEPCGPQMAWNICG